MARATRLTRKPRHDPDPETVTVVDQEGKLDSLVDTLNDPDCRDILQATGETALSAREVSERCDLPISTTYRKLARLSAVGVLEERTRIDGAGKHPSEYVRVVEHVVISVSTAEGIVIERPPRENVGRFAPIATGH